MLALHRPGDAYAVFVFWEGPERRLACWYVNFQDPFRRTAIGFDTLDHELDLVVEPDGSRWLKDEDSLDLRVADGRFSRRRGGGHPRRSHAPRGRAHRPRALVGRRLG